MSCNFEVLIMSVCIPFFLQGIPQPLVLTENLYIDDRQPFETITITFSNVQQGKKKHVRDLGKFWQISWPPETVCLYHLYVSISHIGWIACSFLYLIWFFFPNNWISWVYFGWSICLGLLWWSKHIVNMGHFCLP